MTMPAAAVQDLMQSALTLLRRGDAAGARKAFEAIVAEQPSDAAAQLGLAYACSTLRDHAAALQAAEAALAAEPRNLRALMLKADYLDAGGNTTGAVTCYQAVVASAPPLQQLAPEMQQLVQRAQAICERFAERFETVLQAHVAAACQTHGAASARFEQSIDILLGKKQIYTSMPNLYYFPELAHVQFHGRDAFPWLATLEAATPAIREELLAVLQGGGGFAPYVQADPTRPAQAAGGMRGNPDWSAFFLWKNGELQAENAARCPRTLQALEGVPLTQVPGRSPSVLFSLLRPGARIPAHNGFLNTRLICHLPLIVPPGCGFRVGNETREWIEGQAWVFDDTIEHEAWNESDSTRVILLFEVWRPELSSTERALVNAMFAAVDQHRGGIAGWGI